MLHIHVHHPMLNDQDPTTDVSIHDFFKDVLTAFSFVVLPVPQLGTIVQRS